MRKSGNGPVKSVKSALIVNVVASIGENGSSPVARQSSTKGDGPVPTE